MNDNQKYGGDLIFTDDDVFDAYVELPNGFAYPLNMDMRDLVLKTENQGNTNQCAAYTATSWIESIMWRKTGKPVNYSPVKLYNYAKFKEPTVNTGGLTMPQIMNAIIELDLCPGCTKQDIKYIRNSNDLMRAIHRYGTCLLGFAITESWIKHNSLIMKEASGKNLGGHAVICCGYNDIGVFIQNSWGEQWGKYGFACISWNVFNSQFRCGAYIKNCLNNLE